MSITKLKAAGNWAPPDHDNDDHNNKAGRNLNGRIIFGLLTGNEVPVDVASSTKGRRR